VLERLDEKQLAKLLGRAAEIEAKDRSRDLASPEVLHGYSIAEAESIAREAGISTQSFGKALAELEMENGEKRQSYPLIGNLYPRSQFFISKIPGDEQLETVLDLLDQKVGLHGSGSVRKHKLSWASDAFEAQRTGERVDISVVPSGDKTQISVTYDLRNFAGGIFGGLCGGLGIGGGLGLGGGVGMGALNSPLAAVLFAVGGLLGSYFLARGIFRHEARRAQAEATKLAELIASCIEDTSGASEDAAASPSGYIADRQNSDGKGSLDQ